MTGRPRRYAGRIRPTQFTLRAADIELLRLLGEDLDPPGVSSAIRAVIDDDRRRRGLQVDAVIEREADND